MKSFTIISVLTASLAIAGTAIAQAPATARIRGEIVSVNGDTLVVHRHSGDTVSIVITPTAQIATVRKLALEDIKPGSFIGTAAKSDLQGKLTAQEVVVFPEAGRGTGEGHYAWDLGSHSTMTNANVDAVVKGEHGRDLQLSYKGGNNTVTVPPNVPIVTFVPADRSDLLVSKRVFVIAAASSGNQFVAQRIVVEKDGVVPPM